MRGRVNLRGILTVAAAMAVAGSALVGPGALAADPSPAASGVPGPAASPLDGTGLRIGYISGGDSDPFVLLVTQGIRDQAQATGVELSECDSAFDADKALSCARTLSAQQLGSMINWQFFPDAAQAVCEAYGNLPTVAVDTPEKPCQQTFVGADNQLAGVVAGTGLGDFAKARFDCAYDAYVSLDFPTIPDINTPRAGGSREGFESVCGAIPAEKVFSIDTFSGGPDQPENSRRQVTDLLTTLPDAKVILIISPAGDAMASAALGAADVAGRKDQVWIVGHGADPSVIDSIRNEPQWVGDVGYFPEQYGALIMPLAITLARGGTVPEQSLVDHKFVTRDNIDQFYPAP